jgi:Concanavalin A-like lectin/glucanases superfamily/PASTA domain
MAAAVCDADFANVVLFVDGNSASGSSTFIDQSTVGNTMTSSGSPAAVATSANQLFNQNTINTQDGNGGVTCPVTAGGPLDISTYNSYGWTIEFWAYYEGSFDFPFEIGSLTTGSNGIACEHCDTTHTQFILDGIAGTTNIDNTHGLSLNTWTHIAIQADGAGNLQSYVGGYAGPNPGNFGGLLAISGLVVIGGFYNSGNPDFDWNGQLANFRITGGTATVNGARYPFATSGSQAFIPPTSPFLGTCTPNVPNVVGSTTAAGTAALVSAGYTTTVVQQNSNVIAGDIIMSQAPTNGTLFPLGGNITLTVSAGAAPTAGMGGDQWGAGGGGIVADATRNVIAAALSAAQQPSNAVVAGNISVLSGEANAATPLTMQTPAYLVPKTPQVG